MEFYHDYTALGLSLPQLGGIYPPNQKAKEPTLIRFLQSAIDRLRAAAVAPITLTEMFCADAYYSFRARRMGVDQCDAYDNDSEGFLTQARHISALLNDPNVRLHQSDVRSIPMLPMSSIVMNTGGLYHVRDPLDVLDLSYRKAEHFLIVQTVVSLANLGDSYFDTNRPYGCRFSAAYLERAIRERGWRVVMQDQNTLPGNENLDDRGSVYFLIEK